MMSSHVKLPETPLLLRKLEGRMIDLSKSRCGIWYALKGLEIAMQPLKGNLASEILRYPEQIARLLTLEMSLGLEAPSCESFPPSFKLLHY